MSLTGALKLPPIADTGGDGNVGVDGRMITKTGPQQQMIYRSVPPKPSNFTFSDMLAPSPTGQRQGRTTVVSSNTPAEYEERFKSKPLSKPKVVEFDVGRLSNDSKRRKVNGFFPPVKLRRSLSTRVTSSEMMEVSQSKKKNICARMWKLCTCQKFWDIACFSFNFVFDSFSPSKLKKKNESSSNASNYISNR